tara:strand:- start:737 stop:883 length:147 start_codon:yes stop_codon:yes gene_type:complete
VPFSQHADHAFDTDSTVVPLKLRGLVTKFRRCQRAQLAQLIKRKFRIQ